MNANLDELGKKLHVKLDQGIDQLKTTKAHLEALQKETEATIQTKLNIAKQAVEAKKQEVAAARAKVDEFVEEKKAETKEAVAMRSAMNPEQIPVYLYEQTRTSGKMASPFLDAN